MARMPDLFQVRIPSTAPPSSEPLRWEEIREMAAHGISFGAHTKSHPILSSLENEQQIRQEIEGSRDRLAGELGRAPMHFSYPNGQRHDVTDRIRSLVREAGIQTAVSTESGFNDIAADPFFLRRISMDSWAPRLYFRQAVAGFRT
jgi:peptidoglycan/xylan/chitin deacetylase (PgdA/CDA1 family)